MAKNSFPLSEVSVRTCFLCGVSRLIMPSFVASEVGPSSSSRMVSLVLRSTMLVMAPLCFAPIILSSSQSPRRDLASTIAGRCAMSMQPGIKPRPAVAAPCSLSLDAPRSETAAIYAAVSELESGDVSAISLAR